MMAGILLHMSGSAHPGRRARVVAPGGYGAAPWPAGAGNSATCCPRSRAREVPGCQERGGPAGRAYLRTAARRSRRPPAAPNRRRSGAITNTSSRAAGRFWGSDRAEPASGDGERPRTPPRHRRADGSARERQRGTDRLPAGQTGPSTREGARPIGGRTPPAGARRPGRTKWGDDEERTATGRPGQRLLKLIQPHPADHKRPTRGPGTAGNDLNNPSATGLVGARPRNPLSIRLVDGGHAQRLEVLADDPETVPLGSISLRWNATTGADAWRVQHVRAGIGSETWSGWVAASGPGRTHVITGLTENAPYNVRVEAVNGAVGSLNVRAGWRDPDPPGAGGSSSGGGRDVMATYDTDGTYGLTCSEAAAGGLRLPAKYFVAPGSWDNDRTAAIHRWLGEGKADYDTFGGPLCSHMPRSGYVPCGAAFDRGLDAFDQCVEASLGGGAHHDAPPAATPVPALPAAGASLLAALLALLGLRGSVRRSGVKV